jgi:hypothetical protein
MSKIFCTCGTELIIVNSDTSDPPIVIPCSVCKAFEYSKGYRNGTQLAEKLLDQEIERLAGEIAKLKSEL